MSTATLPRLREEAIVRPFDDGCAQPRYVVAVDGYHFVVTPTVAAILDETRNLSLNDSASETLAHRVSHRLGTRVTPRQVESLLRERAPKALFEPTTGVNAEWNPLLCSRGLFTGARLKPLLVWVSRLFTVRTAIAVCVLSLGIDLFVMLQASRMGPGTAMAADHLWAFALTLVGVFIHELGHLAACHRFGCRHGGIGIGIYWCLPAFYAEVHGAWTLPRKQRAAVDAGGVYLQMLFVGVLGALYCASQAPALLNAIALSHLLMLHTLNPVLKFDGYWLLCDLAGIHNLHRRIQRTARRLLQDGRLARHDAALLAAFIVIALLYFAYLLAVLGHNLGWAAASFFLAAAAVKLSNASLLSALGKGLWLACMVVLAFGAATLLARAGGAVCTERPNGG